MVITKCCEDGAARFMGSNVTVPAVLDGGGTNEKVGHHDTLRGEGSDKQETHLEQFWFTDGGFADLRTC